MKQLTIFCGGCSTEHDITFLSAQNIINQVDKSLYEVTIIYISPNQGWYRLCSPMAWHHLIKDSELANVSHFEPVSVAFDDPKQPWVSMLDSEKRYPVDVAFPVLHGTQGEDGCIQGLLTLLDVPFVGADTLASAVLMSKIKTKQVLQAAGIPCVPFKAWSKTADYREEALQSFLDFGGNVFVKAAHLGSAVGVYQVTNEADLWSRFDDVFSYDEWVMMEPAMSGREIETAVLGNRNQWQVAGPGEIVKGNRFYDFKEKYSENSLTKPIPNAQVTEAERENILSVAKAVAKATDCEGMCRVDGFLTSEGFVINEVNTIPGFTNISLYPAMWESAGKIPTQLIDELLGLAIERQSRQRNLLRSYQSSEVSS